MEFSLVTINTWKCDGNYRRRILLLQEQLLQLKPSIVVCQEVFQSSDANTVEVLAESLQMHYAYTPSRNKQRMFDGNLVDSQSGLAILSKYPIDLFTAQELPMDDRDGERKAQLCILQLKNEAPILIVNTHLSHLKQAKVLRLKQIKAILNHPLLKSTYKAIFLCGDFNSEEESEEIQYLLNHHKFSIRNCYSEGRGKLPNSTLIPKRVNDDRPEGKCIDFIFTVENGTTSRVAVKEASIVLNVPDDDGIFPSDHFGVMVRMQITDIP